MTIENLESDNENIKKVLKLFQIGKISEAINNLEIITKKEKENYKYFFLLGTLYLSLKKLDLSEKNLNISIKLNDKNSNSFHNLACILSIRGNISEAKSYFLKAHEIDNNNIEPLSELGRIFENENNFEEAKKYFERALKIDIDHRKTNLRIGNMYLKMNQHKKGLKFIQKSAGLIRFSDKGFEII